MATEVTLQLNESCTELGEPQNAGLPTLIRDAGVAAGFAFEAFLHGRIRNRFTRNAYLHAVKRFSDWFRTAIGFGSGCSGGCWPVSGCHDGGHAESAAAFGCVAAVL